MRISALLLSIIATVLLQTAEAHSGTSHVGIYVRYTLHSPQRVLNSRSVPESKLGKRFVPSASQDSAGLFSKTLTTIRLSAQHIKDKAEQARELLLPALRRHLEAVARAEVPQRLKSWRMFKDGGTFRETIRKSNTAFVRTLDKIRQPSQEYRYMRKNWGYEPDLRKHYFFPRILRIPIIEQESELPYDKEVENFTKGNDDEFGHRSFVVANLPRYATRFAEKQNTAVAPLDHGVEAAVHETTTSKSEAHQPTEFQQSKQEQASSRTDSSRQRDVAQQTSLQAAKEFWPDMLGSIRPQQAGSGVSRPRNFRDDLSDHSPHVNRQNYAPAADAGDKGSAKPAMAEGTTPRHRPHGSGIFFPSQEEIEDFAHSAAATSNMQAPLQDLAQSDVSAELERQSQTPTQKHAAKDSYAKQVALNFHNTLMDMRHRYNGFLDFQRSQIHKASLRYPEHPEYEPELDPSLGATREGEHAKPAGTSEQRVGGDEAARMTSPKSQPVSPYGKSAVLDAWEQHYSERHRPLSGVSSPRGQQAFGSGSGRAQRYPAHYSEILFASYREVSPKSPRSPVQQREPVTLTLSWPDVKVASRADAQLTALRAPPPSPGRWEDGGGSLQEAIPDSRSSEAFGDWQDDVGASAASSGGNPVGRKGYRGFSSRLDPVEVPLSNEHLQRTVSFFSPSHPGDATRSLQRQSTGGRLSRISSVGSFAFRSPGFLAEHPTPRMPASSQRLLNDGRFQPATAVSHVAHRSDPDRPVFEKIHDQEADAAQVNQRDSPRSDADAVELNMASDPHPDRQTQIFGSRS